MLPYNYLLGLLALFFLVMTFISRTRVGIKLFKYHGDFALITLILVIIHTVWALKTYLF